MIRGWSRRFSDYLVVSPQGYKRVEYISRGHEGAEADFFKE